MQLTLILHKIFRSVLSNAFPCVVVWGDFEYAGDAVLQMQVLCNSCKTFAATSRGSKNRLYSNLQRII